MTKAPHNEELYYSYFKLVEVVYKALLADAESEEYLIIRQLQVRGTKIGPKNRLL